MISSLRPRFIGLIAGTALMWNTPLQAQELNCRVQVIAPQIANVEASIFESLEENIQEFMNGRRWTNDEFQFEERIECTMQITISEAPSPTSFRGNIQVQSSRPVYNSDYNSAMLLVNDGDFEISWDGSSNIQFSIDQYRDNLSSILAYYAYMILGMDYDSMALEGGTAHYLKAQTIVANAQNSGPTGWKASQGNQNRYWLVENMLSQTFRLCATACTIITAWDWINYSTTLRPVDWPWQTR